MAEMAAHLAKESVPLILNHTTQGEAHGRVFAGEVRDGALHTLIALNSKVNADTVEKLNSGITDQVSVAVLTEKCLCSECGFDFFGEEATFENRYYKTCANDHTIGENGVHARLTGLKNFYELSLVGQGASPGARVKGRSEAIMASADLQRLAAQNMHPSMVVLHASPTHPESTPLMDEKILAQLTSQAADLGVARADVVRLTARNTELETLLAAKPTAEVAALQAQVADLQPKADRLVAAEAELAAAPKKDEFDAAVAALTSHATAVLTASGEKDPAAVLAGKSVAEIVALTAEKTTALTALIPVGGAARVASTETVAKPAVSSAAFRSRQ